MCRMEKQTSQKKTLGDNYAYKRQLHRTPSGQSNRRKAARIIDVAQTPAAS